jgi:hypothetical protein
MRVAGYEFSDGARFQSGAKVDDPKIVGAHIDMLRQQQHGELTPEDVLKDAANPNSPLHTFFEWNDTEAARQHRLHQARGLIRAVVAVYVSDDKPAVRTRAFVHIPEPSTPHYRSAAAAMSTTKTRTLVLQQAWREFQQWKRRYKDLHELAALFTVADELEDQRPELRR